MRAAGCGPTYLPTYLPAFSAQMRATFKPLQAFLWIASQFLSWHSREQYLLGGGERERMSGCVLGGMEGIIHFTHPIHPPDVAALAAHLELALHFLPRLAALRTELAHALF